jgi:hypothetical protein
MDDGPPSPAQSPGLDSRPGSSSHHRVSRARLLGPAWLHAACTLPARYLPAACLDPRPRLQRRAPGPG